MNQGDNEKPDTAKSAIADYYGDLLGSISEDPLKKLEDAERRESQTRAQIKSPSESKVILKRASRREAQSKKNALKTTFFQSEKKPDVLTSVVIPASLPTLMLEKPQALKAVEKTTAAPSSTKESESVITTRIKDVVSEAPKIESKAVSREKEAGIPSRPATKSKESTTIDVQESPEESTVQPHSWLENGRPPWGQERFECLLFSVAGLKLAVPLISLGSIYKIGKELTPLVGRADWFMGLYQSGDRNIKVVDTAKWVMPERYSDKVKEGYQFIIRLGGNNWGMACDSVEQSVQLEPSQVKWRSVRSKRPWLSGTVIDHMCALLDADTLSYLLKQQEKPQSSSF